MNLGPTKDPLYMGGTVPAQVYFLNEATFSAALKLLVESLEFYTVHGIEHFFVYTFRGLWNGVVWLSEMIMFDVFGQREQAFLKVRILMDFEYFVFFWIHG